MTIYRPCRDCGASEGQFHACLCTQERCPFCGGQLLSCDCCYELLGLVDDRTYGADTAHLPPDIYANGLPGDLQLLWLRMLGERGRVVYIVYPQYCARCGMQWPDFFMVTDEVWER